MLDTLAQVGQEHIISELFSELPNFVYTVLGGTLIFVLGQVCIKFFVEPIHEQRGLIGEIGDSLIYYGDVYGDPGGGKPDAMDEASNKFRQQAAQLSMRTNVIPWYGLFPFFKFVRRRKNVTIAIEHLMSLSNSIRKKHPKAIERNSESRKQIAERLNLKIDV